MRLWTFCLLIAAELVDAAAIKTYQHPFQDDPELSAEPTDPGQKDIFSSHSISHVSASHPEIQSPLKENPANFNMLHMFGELSHYFPNPTGFGVDEYPLPEGANITTLYMLHRHGARFPTAASSAKRFGRKMALNKGKFNAFGRIEFLNSWKDKTGAEILVPLGKQELFDSGAEHHRQYGHLDRQDGKKIVARSTTQNRMTESAQCFLAGFFGPEWESKASLELIIEWPGFNNTLAGYFQCNNSLNIRSRSGTHAIIDWAHIYLADATERIQSSIEPHDFLDVIDVYDMQTMCAYEIAAFGFSDFCGLFTREEWQGYRYSVDIKFYGDNSFGSPTGRSVGIGWVAELLARLKHHYITKATAQVNVTLDSSPTTFPLDQNLYFDFSHDTNIMSVLTALGLTQFKEFLPTTEIIPHELIVSHLEPFAARLDIELIVSPRPIESDPELGFAVGGPTTYIHFLLNQRTIPLHASYSACAHRLDGWCELDDFLHATQDVLAASEYDFSCFGEYENTPYGKITNGIPWKKEH